MRRERGFSLLELMIVVGIAMALVAIGISWLNAERKRVARGEAITQQAVEMSTLGRALDQYLRDDGGEITNTVTSVTAEELVEAKLLPANFAVRDQFGATATSPLGQNYTMLAREIDGAVRGVVVAMGTPSAAVMSRVGIKSASDAFVDFQAAVTRQMRQQQYIASALIPVGGTVADRSVSNFDYDFAGFLGGPVSGSAWVAAMAGFPEFSASPEIVVRDGGGEGGGGAISEGSLMGRECSMRTNQSCGQDEEVWKHSVCNGWHRDNWSGQQQTTTSLGSSVVRISRVVQSSLQASGYSVGNLNVHGRELEQREVYDSWNGVWTYPSADRPTNFGAAQRIITDNPAGTGLAGPTDHYYAIGPFVGTVLGNNTSSGYRINATGAVWRVARTLQSCGGVNESETPVYELLSGEFQYLPNSRSGQDAPMTVGAQVLSAIDPNMNGGRPAYNIFSAEQVSIDGVNQFSMICGGRWLSSRTVSAFGFNITSNNPIFYGQDTGQMVSTFTCPSRRGAQDNNSLSGTVAPIRAFAVDAPSGATIRYCCKKRV